MKTDWNENDDKLLNLLSKMFKKIKDIRTLKGTIAKYHKELEVRDNTVLKLKEHIQRNWMLLFRFRSKLERSEPLTSDEENIFSSGYQEFIALGFSKIEGISEDMSTIANHLRETSNNYFGCSEYSKNYLDSEVCRSTGIVKDATPSYNILSEMQCPTAQASNNNNSSEIKYSSSKDTTSQTLKFNDTVINEEEWGRKCIVQVKRITPYELNEIFRSQSFPTKKRRTVSRTPLLPIRKSTLCAANEKCISALNMSVNIDVASCPTCETSEMVSLTSLNSDKSCPEQKERDMSVVSLYKNTNSSKMIQRLKSPNFEAGTDGYVDWTTAKKAKCKKMFGSKTKKIAALPSKPMPIDKLQSGNIKNVNKSKCNVNFSAATESHCSNRDISIGNKKTKMSNFDIGDNCLRNFFQLFEYALITPENLNDHALSLLALACNPYSYIDVNLLLFHVLSYIHKSKTNPLLAFSSTKDPSVFLPVNENCIVTAILLIEDKKKSNLEGLLEKALITTYDLILSKKLLPLTSLAALSRFLTEICKRQGITANPVILCTDLLKMKHKFASYLIASIAGVWPELFQNSKNLEAEELLLHSSISYGASKDLYSDCRGISIMHIISESFTAPPISNTRSALCNMKKLLDIRCKNCTWNGNLLMSAMVILAAYEEWNWNEEHLLKRFIIPNLTKFGRQDLNEHAFDLFCNLYVDILLLNQKNPCDTVLLDFFNNSSSVNGKNFVRDCAALSLIKFVFKKNELLPLFLSEWFEGNHQNPKVQQIKPIIRRRAMSENLKLLQFEDILQSRLQ